MSEQAAAKQAVRLILRHLSRVKDSRVRRTRLYRLSHLLFMALCAVVGGADGAVAIEVFVADRKALFEGWLGVRWKRTPSHDTFSRVLGALSPALFEGVLRTLLNELASLGPLPPGEVVALDGKAVRGAVKRGGGVLHLLHAFAAGQQLLLKQVAVEGAPVEVGALPALIRSLEVKDAVITADANGCTREVAEACVEKGADFVLALKGNRGRLHRHFVRLFVALAWQGKLPRGKVRAHAQREAGHGRQELREAWALAPEAWPMDWPGLESVVLVHRVRWLPGKPPQEQWHLYISSLPANAKRLSEVIRNHWAVENRLHWMLDVQMGEDRRRVRHQAAAENLACLSRLALHLLKREKSTRLGIALKRAHAAGNNDYLGRVLTTGLA